VASGERQVTRESDFWVTPGCFCERVRSPLKRKEMSCRRLAPPAENARSRKSEGGARYRGAFRVKKDRAEVRS